MNLSPGERDPERPASSIQLGEPDLTRAFELLHDLTDRLSSVEVAIETVFDHAPVIVVIASEERFVVVNDRLCEVLGYTPEELTGRPWIEFVHPDDRPAARAIAEQLHRGDASHFTNHYVTKDGRAVRLTWHARAWNDAGLTLAIATTPDESGR